MEINFKTIQEYLEERYNKIQVEGIYYYYDMTGKIVAIEENDVITMYYDAPEELVKTPYGKLAVSVIDNFKVATKEKTTLINALNISHLTRNRNNIKILKNSVILPIYTYELVKNIYNIGAIGTLQQDNDNKYHLTNDDFDIEFKNKEFVEDNSMENFKILSLKEIESSEQNIDLEKINLNKLYEFYFNYFMLSGMAMSQVRYNTRNRRSKSCDLLETAIVTNNKLKSVQKKYNCIPKK